MAGFNLKGGMMGQFGFIDLTVVVVYFGTEAG